MSEIVYVILMLVVPIMAAPLDWIERLTGIDMDCDLRLLALIEAAVIGGIVYGLVHWLG